MLLAPGHAWWPCVWIQSPFPGQAEWLPVKAKRGVRSGKQERNLILDLRVCIVVYQSEPSLGRLRSPSCSAPDFAAKLEHWTSSDDNGLGLKQKVLLGKQKSFPALFSICIHTESFIYACVFCTNTYMNVNDCRGNQAPGRSI